jgi:hypothetical protein
MQVDLKEVLSVIVTTDIEKAEWYEANSPYYLGWERGILDSIAVLRKKYDFHDDWAIDELEIRVSPSEDGSYYELIGEEDSE